MSTRTFPKSQRFLKISFFIGLFLFAFNLGFFVVNAAYERYATGDTAVIGEFVYDDNFVATTTAGCTLSIYNPSGTLLVNAASMTADANGYTHYSYSVPSTGPEGVWPTQMTCGSVPNGDLVKLDKTFVVGATIVSTTTLASSVWTSATRTLTSVGTLVADVWAYGTRTLTGASLDSGSLATQADVLTASSSLAATIPTAVWANGTRSLTTFGSLAADVWNIATSTLTAAGTAGKQLVINYGSGGGGGASAARTTRLRRRQRFRETS
jgi:hypothetical protein